MFKLKEKFSITTESSAKDLFDSAVNLFNLKKITNCFATNEKYKCEMSKTGKDQFIVELFQFVQEKPKPYEPKKTNKRLSH